MAARVKIEVREIRGPWLDVIIKRAKKHYVMGIISAHQGPGLSIPPHTAEPEVFPGVWKLTPYSQESAGGVKLIGIQAELFSEDFKRINGAVRRWRFKLVVNKSGVGFFKVEGVAVVSHSYVTRTEELMQFLDEHPIVVDVRLIPFIVGQGSNSDLFVIGPAVCEA